MAKQYRLQYLPLFWDDLEHAVFYVRDVLKNPAAAERLLDRTEAAIRESFENNLKGTTVIMIAQRVSSVRRAAEIFVLDDDHVAAHGTHDELLASCPIYQEICRSQQEGVSE